MPRIWAEIPDVHLTLLGSDPPREITALHSERVHVPGYVEDVSDEFGRARIFVAPLRYGAGVKGKIGQALSFRVPVVTTSIGAEGFNFRRNVDALIADDTESFARAVIELYRDSGLWADLAYRAASILEPFSTKAVVDAAQRAIGDVIAARRDSALSDAADPDMPMQRHGSIQQA